MNSFALGVYSLLMRFGQPLLRRKLARRGGQEAGYLQAVEERFGVYTQPAEPCSELVWLHAVSLGETRTAALLIEALRAQHPGLRILLTHGTATGRAEGLGLIRPGDVQVWQPWDSAAAVAGFFQHFRPRLGLLMETEVWPNTVAAAQALAIPLLLVNGRLSDKSLQQALRMAPLSRPAYGALAAVYAQTEGDAQRFGRLGAKVAGVFGNLKFDATPDAGQLAQGSAWRQALGRMAATRGAQPVLMFASSRDGEEELFFQEIMALAQQRRAQAAINLVASSAPASCQFLVVPRHPQRFDEAQALAEKYGLRVSRRSSWLAGPADSKEALQADIWLGDSIGEMALYYALSEVALLGGSFAPLGGQNLIEAAACGCPVVMGPHTFNFAEAAEQAETVGAARRVADLPQALQAALQLLGDRQARAGAMSASLAFAARNRGATAHTLRALQPFLQKGSAGS